MIADEGLQRIAPARNRGLIGAQLIGMRAQGCFLAALGLQSFAQASNLRFQTLKRFRSRFETKPGLSAFGTQVFLLVARLAYLRVQAF